MESTESLSYYVDGDNYDGECKLCTQFIQQTRPNLFNRIFGNEFSPVISETDNFVWGIGLGQIIEGYTLLMVKTHVFSMGEVMDSLFDEYLDLKSKIIHKYESIYHIKPLIFEHGSIDQCIKAGSCIDHAHLHFFPVNVNLFEDLKKLFDFKKVESIKETKNYADDFTPYFYVENTNSGDKYLFYNIFGVQSQYLRALLSDKIPNAHHWNWKNYIGIEEMIAALNKLI